MSDALPLPPRPNLEQYKKLARELQRASHSSEAGAVRDLAARWSETIMRLRGLAVTAETRRQIEADAERMERHWAKLKNTRTGMSTLSDAQFLVARGHGFAAWPVFAKHLNALTSANSPVSQFEAAADAIVSGDRGTVQRLLGQNPELIRARSTREHQSTLLHYVSANGVENFRQRTPENILEITMMLLNAGADVNAESEAYGGRSTTLELTATSWHPENAGVQLALLELLIEHGANIDRPDARRVINSCLHNGRGRAAEFLASRGARLDLEEAAGVGQLDLVKSFFGDDGSLTPPTTLKQMTDGFAWACEFGRVNVVDFLLRRGMQVDAKLRPHGQTGMHWASYGGHVDTVRLLLERSAPVNSKDDDYDGTPLGWALYAWGNLPQGNLPPDTSLQSFDKERYYEIVALLVRAGATVDSQSNEAARSDARMSAALRGDIL